MSIRKRHPASRFIALLTAAVMPLCCCIVSTATGTSCCTTVEIVQPERSCCSTSSCQEAAPAEQSGQPCEDSLCSCCIKAPVSATNWTPPIDTIGTALPAFTLVERLEPATAGPIWGQPRGTDPPPRPRDPDQLRGHVILQV